jgi:hypothetical protein
MERFEYKVVPAPARGEKVKGAKTTPDRFAHALTALMNQMALDGWEYQRADTLPCEERVGFTGKTVRFQHMLVFRRLVEAFASEPAGADATAGQLVAAPPPRPQPAGIAPLSRLPSAADGPKIGPAKADTAAQRAPIPLFGARRNGAANRKEPDAQT